MKNPLPTTLILLSLALFLVSPALSSAQTPNAQNPTAPPTIPPPVATVTTVTDPAVRAELLAKIQQLLTLIAELQKQLNAMQAGTGHSHHFNTNLHIGDKSEDVRQLQIFLNQNPSTRITTTGAGSPGQETTYFGNLTKLALIKYQNLYKQEILVPVGLTTGSGFFGPATRNHINALSSQPVVLNAGNSTTVPDSSGTDDKTTTNTNDDSTSDANDDSTNHSGGGGGSSTTNHPAVINGTDTGTITEDDNPDQLTVSGTLTITDSDSGEDAFIADTINGDYGELTIDTNGHWSYTADNNQASIQDLNDGNELTDLMTVSSVDGTTHNVVVTIFGVGEPATMLAPDVDVVITLEDVETQSLKDIVDSYGEDTRFLIKAGTYRMQTISPKKGMVFYGDVDTEGNRYTILNGSRLLTEFGQADGLYFATGQTQEGHIHGTVETGWEGSRHSDDLFFDDVALKQVMSKAEVTNDTWYFDYANDTIWFARNPNGKKVEANVTPYAFHQIHNQSTAPQVTIKGFVVEKYAGKAQKGAIGGEGDNEQWYVAYNETRLNHSSGILVGDNSTVMHNYSHHNGQKGMSGIGDELVFQGNEMSYNNTQHFKTGWDSGGAKFAVTDSLTFKNNYVHHNYGRGLWIDLESHNVNIDNNLITYNYNEGILYEISDTGTISNNRFAHNGQAGTWLYGSGVVISSSADVEVFGNTVIVNPDYGNGITALWTDRHLNNAFVGHTPPLRFENIYVHDNDITYLGVLNIQEGRTPVSGGAAAAGVDGYDKSGTIDGVPPDATVVAYDVDITDSGLNNLFDNNAYHVPDLSLKWFRWGRSASRISWDDFRAFGNETDGTVDDNVTDASVNWTWTSFSDYESLTNEVVW